MSEGRGLVCENVCDWRSCEKDCPKAEIWREFLKFGNEIHSLNRRRILDSAASCLEEIIGLKGCAIKVLGEEGEPSLVAARGMGEEDLRSFPPEADGRAIFQKNYVMFDLKDAPFVAVPITFKGRGLGAIYAQLGAGSSRSVLPFIRAMADCLGVALENERRYRIAIGNWHEAVKELWSKLDVWRSPKELPEIPKGT
ncbi:MAG: hypothetical protein QXU06_05200 [Candidatus Bathyarchaeia archaeon]